MNTNSTRLNVVECTLESSKGYWAGILTLAEDILSFTPVGEEEEAQPLNYPLREVRRVTSLAGRNILMVDVGKQTLHFTGVGLNKFGLSTIDRWNELNQEKGAFPLQFEHLRSSAGAVEGQDDEKETVRAKELCLRVTKNGYSPGLLAFTNQWVGFGPSDARGEPRDEYAFRIELANVQGVKVIRERNETVIQTADRYERLVGEGAVRMGDRLRVILGNRLPSSTLMRLRAIATSEVPILEDFARDEELKGQPETIVAEGSCIGRAGQLSLPGRLVLTPLVLRFLPEESDMWDISDVWEKPLDEIDRVSVLGADRAVFWVGGEAFRFLGREANEVGTKLVKIRGLSLPETPPMAGSSASSTLAHEPPNWPEAAIVPFERVLGHAHTLEIFVHESLAFSTKPCRLALAGDGVGILLHEAPHVSLSWGEELRVQLFRDDGRYYFDSPLIRTGLAPRDMNIGEKPAWYMLTIQEGHETRFSNLRTCERVAVDDQLVRLCLNPEEEVEEQKVLQSHMVNLSAGGCLVRNDTSMAVEHHVGLEFELSDGPISVEAKCLRSMRPRRREDPWHCAFIFVDLNETDEERLSNYVDSLVGHDEEA